MFGSKRRAKAKAEKLQTEQRKKEVSQLALKKELDRKQEQNVKDWYPQTQYTYSIDPKTGMAVADYPSAKYAASLGPDTATLKVSELPQQSHTKEWYNTIEGSLDADDKFAIQFDGEATLENLQMISNVLNLHISKLRHEKYRDEQKRFDAETKTIQRQKDEVALIDKRLKEQREHELKVIVAKKDAGVPLVQNGPNTPPGTVAGMSIPDATHQLNGHSGPQQSADYAKYQQMQSGIVTNGTKQYGY